MIKAQPKKNKTFSEAIEDNIGRRSVDILLPTWVTYSHQDTISQGLEKLKIDTEDDVEVIQNKTKREERDENWNKQLRLSLNQE